MRDVLNLNPINTEESSSSTISFESLPAYDKTDYDLNIPKEFERFITDVKRDARNSFEYHQYMDFLKKNLDMNKCSFFESIKNENTKRVKIEIHHDPFTIEDIIRIVVRKRQCYYESMEPEQVSKEVMYLHYRLMVGLIPLSATVHELVGNNYLFIPTTHIMGNYKEFVERYNDFIDPEMIATLNRIEEATQFYDENRYKDLLKRHYIYINVGDMELPSYEAIVNLMKEQLVNINNRAGSVPNPNGGLPKALIKVEYSMSDGSKIDIL